MLFDTPGSPGLPTYCFFSLQLHLKYVVITMETEGEGLDPVKRASAPRHPALSHTPVICYWPFQGATFILVLFVKCSVVFHLQMFFFLNNCVSQLYLVSIIVKFW